VTIGSLFSGIGGLDLGLERAGLGPVAWQAERDPFCRRVLAAHWPGVPCFNDVREVRHGRAEAVEIICGGFPCQPFSVAGNRLGTDDDRYLWPEFRRVVAALVPAWVVVENVPGLRTRGLCVVLDDLAALGFDAEWFDLRASDVGAPHRRERLFVVAHRDGATLDRFRERLDGAMADARRGAVLADAEREHIQRCRGARDVACETSAPRGQGDGGDSSGDADCDSCEGVGFPSGPLADPWRGPLPTLCGSVDGVPDRLDRLAALGNAVVPAVAEMIGRAIAAAALALLLIAAPASAQDPALMLARSCVSERSWRTDTADCGAIASVVVRRMASHGQTFADAIRSLAPRLHGGTITARPWLLELDRSLERPRHLGRARWEGMRLDAWIATLAEADAIIEAINAGTYAGPCAGPVAAWGSADDLRRRERLSGRHWVEVRCGDTSNHFGGWRWPREVDPE